MHHRDAGLLPDPSGLLVNPWPLGAFSLDPLPPSLVTAWLSSVGSWGRRLRPLLFWCLWHHCVFILPPPPRGPNRGGHFMRTHSAGQRPAELRDGGGWSLVSRRRSGAVQSFLRSSVMEEDSHFCPGGGRGLSNPSCGSESPRQHSSRCALALIRVQWDWLLHGPSLWLCSALALSPQPQGRAKGTQVLREGTHEVLGSWAPGPSSLRLVLCQMSPFGTGTSDATRVDCLSSFHEWVNERRVTFMQHE